MREVTAGEWIQEAKGVYASLADEESRAIFEKRFLYELTGNMEHIDWIIRNYVPEFKDTGVYNPEHYRKYLLEIEKRAAGRRIVIYGAGFNGRCLFEGLHGEQVAAFCDKKAEVKEYRYCGKPVITPGELLEKYRDSLVVVSAFTYGAEIAENLISLGIKAENILFDSNGAWGKCYSIRQYFEPDIIQLKDREIFVDGGSFDGNTFRELKRLAGNMEPMILAFEPDDSNYEICEKLAEKDGFRNVKLFKAGLWSRKASLSFAGNVMQGAHVTDETPDNGDMTVHCVALDDVAEELGISPTFIKLDVEGSELEALKGAEKILKRDKPKLAICVYHKPEDIITIPAYIKAVRPDYKLYIRHYSNWVVETVLYAV